MTSEVQQHQLIATDLSSEAFAPYGQVICPQGDGKPYDQQDAQLNLANGTPRFYIMRLTYRGQRFHRITHHKACTQCLGSLGGLDWLMVVAPPGDRPTPENLRAFRIPGDCFIKLNQGTWHAGPYFTHEVVDFYNLELSDTNVADHHNYDFRLEAGVEFEII